jgi:hypothetical protein
MLYELESWSTTGICADVRIFYKGCLHQPWRPGNTLQTDCFVHFAPLASTCRAHQQIGAPTIDLSTIVQPQFGTYQATNPKTINRPSPKNSVGPIWTRGFVRSPVMDVRTRRLTVHRHFAYIQVTVPTHGSYGSHHHHRHRHHHHYESD